MSTLDAVSAMLMVGVLGAAAAFAFARGFSDAEARAIALPRGLNVLHRPGVLLVVIALLSLGNAAIHPNRLLLSFAKGKVEDPRMIEHMRWNSYSGIRAEKTVHGWPAMWGASPAMPKFDVDQRYMNIDGDAGTAMYRFSGNLQEVDFLKYDVTSLAY
jgi:hypothetical protein